MSLIGASARPATATSKPAYVPGRSRTVSPADAESRALVTVRKGAAIEPRASSEPSTATTQVTPVPGDAGAGDAGVAVLVTAVPDAGAANTDCTPTTASSMAAPATAATPGTASDALRAVGLTDRR